MYLGGWGLKTGMPYPFLHHLKPEIAYLTKARLRGARALSHLATSALLARAQQQPSCRVPHQSAPASPSLA